MTFSSVSVWGQLRAQSIMELDGSLNKGDVGDELSQGETLMGPESAHPKTPSSCMFTETSPPQARSVELEAKTIVYQPIRDQKFCETSNTICIPP